MAHTMRRSAVNPLQFALRQLRRSRIGLFKRSYTATAANLNLPPLTRRLFKLPQAPAPPSQDHNDLPSFEAYAARNSLSESSTLYIGTHYEYIVQRTLRGAGLNLCRVGGRDDAGIDLAGTWHLPMREHPVRVFAQCKALRTKASPNLVRELEGTFRSSPLMGLRTNAQKVGMLVCQREATKGVRDALARSTYPLVWMMVERGGLIRQALWNEAVEDLGLISLGVEVVYGSPDDVPHGDIKGKINFTWDGSRVPHIDRAEKEILRVQEEWFGLWGDISEDSRESLLDAVEKLYPEERPLLTSKERRSTLSDTDRARVLEELNSKVHLPKDRLSCPAVR